MIFGFTHHLWNVTFMEGGSALYRNFVYVTICWHKKTEICPSEHFLML
jgi:hypothetical protein